MNDPTHARRSIDKYWADIDPRRIFWESEFKNIFTGKIYPRIKTVYFERDTFLLGFLIDAFQINDNSIIETLWSDAKKIRYILKWRNIKALISWILHDKNSQEIKKLVKLLTHLATVYIEDQFLAYWILVELHDQINSLQNPSDIISSSEYIFLMYCLIKSSINCWDYFVVDIWINDIMFLIGTLEIDFDMPSLPKIRESWIIDFSSEEIPEDFLLKRESVYLISYTANACIHNGDFQMARDLISRWEKLALQVFSCELYTQFQSAKLALFFSNQPQIDAINNADNNRTPDCLAQFNQSVSLFREYVWGEISKQNQIKIFEFEWHFHELFWMITHLSFNSDFLTRLSQLIDSIAIDQCIWLENQSKLLLLLQELYIHLGELSIANAEHPDAEYPDRLSELQKHVQNKQTELDQEIGQTNNRKQVRQSRILLPYYVSLLGLYQKRTRKLQGLKWNDTAISALMSRFSDIIRNTFFIVKWTNNILYIPDSYRKTGIFQEFLAIVRASFEWCTWLSDDAVLEYLEKRYWEREDLEHDLKSDNILYISIKPTGSHTDTVVYGDFNSDYSIHHLNLEYDGSHYRVTYWVMGNTSSQGKSDGTFQKILPLLVKKRGEIILREIQRKLIDMRKKFDPSSQITILRIIDWLGRGMERILTCEDPSRMKLEKLWWISRQLNLHTAMLEDAIRRNNTGAIAALNAMQTQLALPIRHGPDS